MVVACHCQGLRGAGRSTTGSSVRRRSLLQTLEFLFGRLEAIRSDRSATDVRGERRPRRQCHL